LNLATIDLRQTWAWKCRQFRDFRPISSHHACSNVFARASASEGVLRCPQVERRFGDFERGSDLSARLAIPAERLDLSATG
jgi:hypothetical protein